MVILTNAFSLQMVNGRKVGTISYQVVSADEVVTALDGHPFLSAVGHEKTAQFLTDLLGIKIDCNRMNIHLEKGDTLIVAQYVGGRLPENGTVELKPEMFKFYKIEVRGWM